MRKILTVIGARPQFIKAGVVSAAIARVPTLSETILHTGQHFDQNMSDIFFEQLGIPKAKYLLDINGGGHGSMTGRMLAEIEQIILSESPDRVLVYGDTNSTLAGALAAAKLHVPVAHVEAGLRSFNMGMPEEINRILTDQISDILFCPTATAIENLAGEGFANRPVDVLNVGDVMQDAALLFSKMASRPCHVDDVSGFILVTIHRAENTDDIERLKGIVNAINELSRLYDVVIPLHPRTRSAIAKAGLVLDARVIEPVGYFEMIWLLKRCALVMTDSGGVQKEAFFFNKPCVTTRDETEWTELVSIGANKLVGADTDRIISAVRERIGSSVSDDGSLYGGGCASERISARLSL